uniref:FACT complex subunit SSRP1 n=1 Tax=Octactis speculum TaxID=3111310 RepID=A0A7S2F6D7_9STRA|mmetsp:Transcript_14698/g.19594  ORF Transcript_14698/g.19594 Transcript_14698/m.19594 type:complete len:746 (+) Transcript_14698:228-2465(+)
MALLCASMVFVRVTSSESRDISRIMKSHLRKKSLRAEVATTAYSNSEKKKTMHIRRNDEELLDVNLQNVSQCVVPGNKQDEIEVQFHESDTSNREEQTLVAMRLWVPNSSAASVQSTIMDETNISSYTGHSLVEFEQNQGKFITPRAQYSIELYDAFFRMHGNMYDYKIKYSDISRYYMLERSKGRHFNFIICLDKPIRQGQQKYPNLVWQTPSQHAQITVNMTEEEIATRFKDHADPSSMLQPVMSGMLHALIARIFKALTGKMVFSHSRKYSSANGEHCIKCAHKARNGDLYPNDKSFVFLHQPTLVIHFADIDHVEFERPEQTAQSVTRNFDLVIQLKEMGGGEKAKKFSFSAIEKKEYQPLIDFLKTKPTLTIRNLEMAEEAAVGVNAMLMEQGDDDDDMEESEDGDYNSADQSAGSDDDDDDGSDGEMDDEEEPDRARVEKKREVPTKKKKPKKTASPQRRSPSPSGSEESDGGSDDSLPPAVAVPNKKVKATMKKRESSPPPPEPKKAGKKKKDPLAPKGKRSAYMLYSNSVRADIKAANPSVPPTEIMKLVAASWNSLDDEGKVKWKEEEGVDKLRHEQEMMAYEPSAEFLATSTEAPKSKKKKKDPNAPKKPTTTYFAYIAEKRAQVKIENPDASVTDVSKLLGAQWKALSAEDKAPFEEMARKDKIRYQEEMKTYTPPAAEEHESAPAPKKLKLSVKPKSEPEPERAESDDDAGSDSDASSIGEASLSGSLAEDSD